MGGAGKAALAILAPALGLVLGLTVVGGGIATPPASAASSAAGSLCASSGPVATLTDEQAQNARVIVATAQPVGGVQGAEIAVMTAITESGLRSLYYGDQAGPDSRGLFQQRDSWGTLAQRLDPVQSTGLFMARLVNVPSWQTLDPWVAAQKVQISAFDGNPRQANNYNSEYGGNYHVNYAQAQGFVALIDQSPVECETLTVPADAVNHGLPADYRIPSTATADEAKVIAYALAQLDKPYVFATSGPDSFDCSGLTAAAWEQVGVQLPHWTITQAQAGTAVPDVSTASPGDLVLVAGDGGTVAAPDHVGLYMGDGLVVSATAPETGIRVVTFANFVQYGGGLSTIRHIK